MKEYDKYNCELLFSGEYLNRIRNGYGEEYRLICDKNEDKCDNISRKNSKLMKIFEGEYVNGERKKGKEYNNCGKIVYDGEYLHGKRNGKGKAYDKNGNMVYEGEFLNGMKHGKGIEYNRYDSVYEGEFLFGKKNGKGKEYDYDNYNKFKHNFGERLTDLMFEGEFFNDFRLKGKEYYDNGKLKYEGEY